MEKLTRYESFEALKSDYQVSQTDSIKAEKRYSEFEAFINDIQRRLLTQKKRKQNGAMASAKSGLHPSL